MPKTASGKISFITTIYNESATIISFLDSLFAQTKLPDEIVIVDGGSSDSTITLIEDYSKKVKRKTSFIIFSKKGNRSVGRNAAIKKASGNIIVCSDAGNILDKKWIENISQPFVDKKVDVVAGYYKAKPKNIFQKCLLPFTFVMPDKVNPKDFLPATRSIAFTKKIWGKIGGFNENLSHNEDYDFALRLKEKGAHIAFAKKAIVFWIPRNNIKESFVMFFRFAFGDAEAHIWRPKVLLLFLRYSIGLYFIFLCLLYKSIIGGGVLIFLLILYIIWSIQKNYHYVKDKRAVYILPVLQFTADMSVLLGTSLGFLQYLSKSFSQFSIKKHWFLFLVIFSYAAILLITIRWGIPNQQHPFPYHMDEWHQLQAVGNTFRYGTPNTDGSANGTMFHFLLSGFYLAPFYLFHIVDPFSLQIDNYLAREKIFEILRIQTLLFGIFSMILLYKLAGMINASKKIVVFLFTFSPIWLMLSGYFKYDIALIFWIILSFVSFIYFAKNPSNKNFLLASLPTSLAFAVKFSAIALIPVYFSSFFFFYPHWKKNLHILGGAILLVTFFSFIFGFPDTLFGKGNILYYLYDNIIYSPSLSENFTLGINNYNYLFFIHNPIVFGYGIYIFFFLSVLYVIYLLALNHLKEKRIILFILFSAFVFIASTLILQLGAVGNRSLVLLPFFVLFIGIAAYQLHVRIRFRPILYILIAFAAVVQVIQSYLWLSMKIAQSPQETSSVWIEKNIPKKETIGIENIPIYQYLPNIIEKEFYFREYHVKHKFSYKYKIVDAKSDRLPSFIIITNGEIEQKILKDSPKKSLLFRIDKEGYRKRISFYRDRTYRFFGGNDIDYYLPGIVTTPLEITVYQKN